MKIEVEVPVGPYCAPLDKDGIAYHPICPLLHTCATHPTVPSYYCAITNYDMHLGRSIEGIKKWNAPPYICPTLKKPTSNTPPLPATPFTKKQLDTVGKMFRRGKG